MCVDGMEIFGLQFVIVAIFAFFESMGKVFYH